MLDEAKKSLILESSAYTLNKNTYFARKFTKLN